MNIVSICAQTQWMQDHRSSLLLPRTRRHATSLIWISPTHEISYRQHWSLDSSLWRVLQDRMDRNSSATIWLEVRRDIVDHIFLPSLTGRCQIRAGLLFALAQVLRGLCWVDGNLVEGNEKNFGGSEIGLDAIVCACYVVLAIWLPCRIDCV